MTDKNKTIMSCLVWVVICLAISGLAGWVTGENIKPWFAYLNKPWFNPPSQVFAPVWTVLYIMIGISGGLIWRKRQEMRLAFVFYIWQLVANFAWSFIFFGARQIGWAFVDIIVLLVLIFLTIVFAFKRSKPAAFLLMPYFCWVIFASILNYHLWQLN